MYSLETLLVIGCIFSFAAMVHGVCGFGFSLLSVGLLSLIIGPKCAVPLDLIAASANCFYLAWLLRKTIMFKEILVLVVLTVVFVPLGTLFLRNFDRTVIVRGIGVVTVLMAVISILQMKQLKIFASGYFKIASGVAGGLLGGAFGLPGPPLVLYAYNCGWPLRKAMANLQFVFSMMTFITVISFYYAGLLSIKIVITGFSYMPLVMMFTFFGSWVSKRLKVNYLIIIINFVLLGLGVTLLIKG